MKILAYVTFNSGVRTGPSDEDFYFAWLHLFRTMCRVWLTSPWPTCEGGTNHITAISLTEESGGLLSFSFLPRLPQLRHKQKGLISHKWERLWACSELFILSLSGKKCMHIPCPPQCRCQFISALYASGYVESYFYTWALCFCVGSAVLMPLWMSTIGS